MPEASSVYFQPEPGRQHIPEKNDGAWRAEDYDYIVRYLGNKFAIVRKPYRAEAAAAVLVAMLQDADTQHRADILTGIVKALAGDKATDTTAKAWFEKLMKDLL